MLDYSATFEERKARQRQMQAWRQEGKSLQWIADQYGMTRERVRQILNWDGTERKHGRPKAKEEHSRERYQRRKAAGLCPLCGKARPEGDQHIICPTCRSYQRIYQSTYQRRHDYPSNYTPVAAPYSERRSLGIDWKNPAQVKNYWTEWRKRKREKEGKSASRD